ncbi:MAG TPA: hemerythrin domain-containing protein [Candidatus Dormibacteraeota bacterium]
MSANRSKPDLLFVTLIHQSLRADAARLSASITALDPADRPQRLAGMRAFFGQYCDQLRLHHTHEDNLFFPALQGALGADNMPTPELAAQHETLDAELQATSEGLAGLVDPSGDFEANRAKLANNMSSLVAHLDAHLALEEATVLPLIESALSPTTYKQLEAQARRQTPRPQARFLIPWLVAHATAQQQTALFKTAPPLRFVNWLDRRHYRHLDHALAS